MPTCLAYATYGNRAACQDDGSFIRCTLPAEHSGNHEDRSREHTTGEIVSWQIIGIDSAHDAVDARLSDPEFRCSTCGENTTACAIAAVYGGHCGA